MRSVSTPSAGLAVRLKLPQSVLNKMKKHHLTQHKPHPTDSNSNNFLSSMSGILIQDKKNGNNLPASNFHARDGFNPQSPQRKRLCKEDAVEEKIPK